MVALKAFAWAALLDPRKAAHWVQHWAEQTGVTTVVLMVCLLVA